MSISLEFGARCLRCGSLLSVSGARPEGTPTVIVLEVDSCEQCIDEAVKDALEKAKAAIEEQMS